LKSILDFEEAATEALMAIIKGTKRQQEFEHEALPHMDLLYNFARRMTNSASDADDLVQETYLKAFRFWDKYEKGTKPLTMIM
jgi:DNA-directed RNA polymerase specialized sigma24 family protein